MSRSRAAVATAMTHSPLRCAPVPQPGSPRYGSRPCGLCGTSFVLGRRLARRARAGISIAANAVTNLVLQGRDDRGLIRRGLTGVGELRAAGVKLSSVRVPPEKVWFAGRMVAENSVVSKLHRRA
jgi:hypothetical protein